ncbi:MAG: acyl-CoA thioesterase [Thermodesulfobacteriota bacterium]
MLFAHEREFRVRSYECDAYGHANNATYLMWMQEVELDALENAREDLGMRLAGGGRISWREVDIDYLKPLRHGDTLVLETWLEGVEGELLRRVYEFRRKGPDETVARASSDSILLEGASGRPATLRAGLVAASLPARRRGTTLSSRGLPLPPPPPVGVFRMRRKVMWQEIDPSRQVNVATLLGHATDCGMEVSAAHRWPEARMRKHGFGIISRRHHLVCGRPAVMDDELEISTWAYAPRGATCMRTYVISRARDNATVMQLVSLYVWVDMATGKPVRIPAKFLEDLAPNIVDLETKEMGGMIEGGRK